MKWLGRGELISLLKSHSDLSYWTTHHPIFGLVHLGAHTPFSQSINQKGQLHFETWICEHNGRCHYSFAIM